MQPNSQFAAAYSKGINKLNYWEPVLEDSIDIIAKLPAVAALIYRNTYKGGNVIESDSKLDWAANLSHMMGEHRNLPKLSFNIVFFVNELSHHKLPAVIMSCMWSHHADWLSHV